MNQKLKMCDIETLKKGDEVLVRAIVEDVKIHSCHTKVSVRQCTDYAGCIWKAKGINSVDVFVLTDCEGCWERANKIDRLKADIADLQNQLTEAQGKWHKAGWDDAMKEQGKRGRNE